LPSILKGNADIDPVGSASDLTPKKSIAQNDYRYVLKVQS